MAKKRKVDVGELTEEELEIVERAVDEITKADTPKVMQIIAQRKQEMSEKVEQYCIEHDLKGATYSVIMRVMTEGNSYVNVNYTPFDMAVLLEWYKDITIKLQKEVYRHRPSRLQFCQLIGISSRTYEKMLMSDDPAMIDVMVRIEDYIQDELFARANMGELHDKIAKFELESVHNRTVVKKTETITKDETVNIDSAKKKLEEIKNRNKYRPKGDVVEAEFTEINEINLDEDE